MNHVDHHAAPDRDGAAVARLSLAREVEAGGWALGAQLDLLQHVLGLAREPVGAASTDAVPAVVLARAVEAIDDASLAVTQLLAAVDPRHGRHARMVADLMRQHGRALHEELPRPTSRPTRS